MRQALIVALLALFLLLIAGCGTVDVNLHTTVKPSGDLIQEFRIEGSGIIGTLMTGPAFAEDFRKEDWQVEIEKSAGRTSLVATKHFKQGESVVIPSPSLEGEEMSAPKETFLEDLDFEVRNGLLTKEYFFEMTLPGSSAESPSTEAKDEFTEFGAEFEEMIEEAVQGMFSMSWTVTLPGQIVETNADSSEGSSATWYFDIDSLERGRHMMIRTRYLNWPALGGLIAVILAAMAGGGVFWLMRKRQAKRL